MNQSVEYEYADGSGNRYEISAAELKYVPVTPENSSSGIYSGGTPGRVTITPDQFNDIQALLENAISRNEIHVNDRMMMTGMITRNASGEIRKIIIEAGTNEMKEIESILHRLLPPK